MFIGCFMHVFVYLFFYEGLGGFYFENSFILAHCSLLHDLGIWLPRMFFFQLQLVTRQLYLLDKTGCRYTTRFTLLFFASYLTKCASKTLDNILRKGIICRENVDRSRPIIAYNDLDFPESGDIF